MKQPGEYSPTLGSGLGLKWRRAAAFGGSFILRCVLDPSRCLRCSVWEQLGQSLCCSRQFLGVDQTACRSGLVRSTFLVKHRWLVHFLVRPHTTEPKHHGIFFLLKGLKSS